MKLANLGASAVVLAGLLMSGSAFAIEPFSLSLKNGPTQDAVFASADHPGSVFVLELYQNSCGPCNRNAPNVDALAADFADTENVHVLDVGVGQNAREFRSWISRHQPNHPVVSSTRVLNQQLGLRSTPTTVVLDCQLNPVYRSVGVWSEQNNRTIRGAIRRALASEACPTPEEEGVEPFTLPIKNGLSTDEVFSSDDHPTSVFVLEVFQSRCSGCILNAPKIDALAEAYAETERVQVLDVGAFNQTDRDYARWIAQQEPNHPVVSGNDNIFEVLDLAGTPTTAILDCNLELLYKHVGAWDEAAQAEVYATIDGALAATECLPADDDAGEEDDDAGEVEEQ